MFARSSCLVACAVLLVCSAPVALGQGDPAGSLKIEIKVEGVASTTVDAVKLALEAIDGIAEVMTGSEGVYLLVVAEGKVVDLNAIAGAVSSVKAPGGPDLRIDIRGVVLSGEVMVEVSGLTAAYEHGKVLASMGSIQGVKAELLDGEKGRYKVAVDPDHPATALDLIQAIGKAFPTAPNQPPKIQLANITWSAGKVGREEGGR